MSSSTSNNLLLDPLSELTAATSHNAFGLSPDPNATSVILDQTFPITPEDKAAVAANRGEDERVVARAKVGLLEGEEVVVVLDRRGYTLESITTTTSKTYPQTTYESLETLLIAISPGYVAAMSREVTKRFEMEGGAGGQLDEGGRGVGGAAAPSGDEGEVGERDTEQREGQEVLVRKREEEERAAEGGSEVWQ